MAKLAILPINNNTLISPINFKQLILLFDKVIIEKNSLELVRQSIIRDKSKKEILSFNNSEIEFLTNNDLLIQHEKDYFLTLQQQVLDQIELKQVGNFNWIQLVEEFERKGLMKREMILNDNQIPYSIARDLSVDYNIIGIEAFPIYKKQPDYSAKGKKEQVVNFALSQLPIPDDNVSWEQLLDFKKDPDSMTKYYALINWINEVSRGELKLNEIEDKFKYLYNDYIQQYKFHKMKSKQSVLEVIATAGIDFIAGSAGFNTIKTSLFSLVKSEMNLIEAEMKFSGKEVAYIVKANQKFK